MRHCHKTEKQKRLDNLIAGFDRFPKSGQVKIAVMVYKKIHTMILHKNNPLMQGWNF